MSAIKISKVVALTLMREAANLFSQGAGMSLDPDSLEEYSDAPAVIDRIPTEDSDMIYWANEILRFARVVHGLLSNAMINEVTDSE